MLFESLIGTIACAGGAAKLTTNHLFFLSDMFNALPHQVMLIGWSFNSWCIQGALSCKQNSQLGLGNAFAIAIDPCQRIVTLSGTHVYQDALRCGNGTHMSTGREDHIGQFFDD